MDDVSSSGEQGEQAGCETCRTWAGDFVSTFRQEPHISTNGTFEVIGEYFSAYMLRCDECRTHWLAGYVEEFSDRPIEAEWGARWWTMRALTPALLAEIVAAEGTRSLDVRTFAALRPGASCGHLLD